MAKQKAFGSQKEKLASMGALVRELKGFRPAGEIITKVQAVPTIFPQYDAATRVGGHPIARIALVHGPSNEGKSSFTLGLGLSFLMRDHFFGLVDAERTTPVEWLVELMGQYRDHPGFVALPSNDYESTVDAVRDFCETVATFRQQGKIAPETSALVVVDSLRKLVPKNLMKKIEQGAVKNGVDGMGGRAAQIKAALNAAWMDELVPLLHETNCAVVLISRETEDPNAGFYDEGIKVGGGKAVNYDASITCRVSRSFIPHPTEELAKRGHVVGERHCVEIRKTKVGKKEAKRPRAFFHTSNGTLSPAGFDVARDVLELGVATGIIDRAGAYYRYDGHTLGQGEVAALRGMREQEELLRAIERDVRNVAVERNADASEVGDDRQDQESGELQQRQGGGADRARAGGRTKRSVPAGKATGDATTRRSARRPTGAKR